MSTLRGRNALTSSSRLARRMLVSAVVPSLPAGAGSRRANRINDYEGSRLFDPIDQVMYQGACVFLADDAPMDGRPGPLHGSGVAGEQRMPSG